MTVFTKIVLSLVIVALLAPIAGFWLVAKSSLFYEMRKEIVEHRISEYIGYTSDIAGELTVKLGVPIEIEMTKVVLPGGVPEENVLAELGRMNLEIEMSSLFAGVLNFSEVEASGLAVTLRSSADGRKTWVESEDIDPDAPKRLIDYEVTEFILSRDVILEDFAIQSFNETSGLAFSGVLSNLTSVFNAQTGFAETTAVGDVNDLPFELKGTYPPDSGQTKFTFGDVVLDLSTQLLTDGRAGYEGSLSLNAASMGDFFTLLDLNTEADGIASLTADFKRTDTGFSLSEIDLESSSEQGRSVSIAGSIGSLSDFGEIDLSLAADLNGFNLELPFDGLSDAVSVDVVTAKITGSAERLELQDVHLDINAAERDIDKIGPFSVGAVMRTPDGDLSLTDVAWTAKSALGSTTNLRGDIQNVFQFRDFNFSGGGTLALQEALSVAIGLEPDGLGTARFDVAINDDQGMRRIEYLNLIKDDGELFSLDVQSSMSNLVDLDGLSFRFDLGGIDTESFSLPDGYHFEASGNGSHFSNLLTSEIALAFGQSDLTFDLTGKTSLVTPEVRGTVTSSKLRASDVDALFSVLTRALNDMPANDADQPPEARPLVVDAGQPQLRIPGMPEIRPLVVGEQGLDDILAGLDVSLDFDVASIVGVPGLSFLDATLAVSNGVLSLSPISTRVAGASGSAAAQIDLKETPDVLNLSGQFNGWKLSEIAKLLDAGLPASGNLNARFDIRGQFESVDQFLRSSNGQIGVFMQNGKIGTSLIELSSYGALQWLFSRELWRGVTEITCVSAPIQVRNGKFATEASVLETQSVQVVLKGVADLQGDRIDFTGQARPIGRPFAASHYPFRVYGKFSAPRVEILKGVPMEGAPRKRIENRTPCVPDIRQVSVP